MDRQGDGSRPAQGLLWRSGPGRRVPVRELEPAAASRLAVVLGKGSGSNDC
jgi:hypothetical protein